MVIIKLMNILDSHSKRLMNVMSESDCSLVMGMLTLFLDLVRSEFKGSNCNGSVHAVRAIAVGHSARYMCRIDRS